MVRKRKVYDLWMEYDNFLRSLHLETETLEKQSEYSREKRFFNYLKRLPIIFFASLLTTLTFQFFINPNKLFNSGLSGIIQVVTNYFFMKNGVSEQNRAVWYYAVVVLVNILIVSVVQFFYPYNFEVNSTAIFYVLFQFIWSSIFRRYSLQNYFFSRFSARSWSNLSSLNQLGLTLPFYITIGVVSAIIHTYGYSLIYQAKSTPGGFEILTSTLAQDKTRKVSIGSLNKLFGIFVVFFITVFNFFVINDSVQLKKNGLVDLVNSNLNILDGRNYKKIENESELNDFLQAANGKDHSSVTRKFLVDWSGDHFFDKLPGGIHTYLKSNRQILEELYQLEKEKKDIVQNHLRSSGGSNENSNDEIMKQGVEEERSFLFHLRARIEEIKKDTYEKNFLGYFKYITNDEKLWASLIYVFFSSYLINQIFPKSKFVLLAALLENNDDLGRMLRVLQKYNPSYFRVLSSKEEGEKDSYLLFCSVTKWEYQLLANEIKEFGRVLVNTLDESN